jgi:chromosome segregation ATPase
MSVSNIKTTVEAVVMPYIIALEQKYKSTLDSTEALLHECQEQLAAVRASNAQMLTSIDQMQSSISAMQTTVDNCNSAVEASSLIELADVNMELSRLTQDLTNLRADVNANSTQIDTVADTVGEHTTALFNLNHAIDGTTTQLNDHIAESNNADTATATTLQAMRNDIATDRANITSLGNTVSDNNTALNNKISGIEGDILDIKSDITTANNNITTNANTIRTNKTAVDAAIMDLQQQIDNL